MAALHPHTDDLVIRRESGDIFTLGVHSGKPQILCSTLEEALQRAGGFAARQHVRTWYTQDGRSWTPLANVGLLRRMWSEYAEMPGLLLTREQAQRLCAVDAETCNSLLKNLVDLQVLVRGPDGQYSRRRNGAAATTLPRSRMAKAGVGIPPASRVHRYIR